MNTARCATVTRRFAKHAEDLARFNRAAVGREVRMIDLKKEINELCAAAGQPPRYALDFESGGKAKGE